MRKNIGYSTTKSCSKKYTGFFLNLSLILQAWAGCTRTARAAAVLAAVAAGARAVAVCPTRQPPPPLPPLRQTTHPTQRSLTPNCLWRETPLYSCKTVSWSCLIKLFKVLTRISNLSSAVYQFYRIACQVQLFVWKWMLWQLRFLLVICPYLPGTKKSSDVVCCFSCFGYRSIHIISDWRT